MTLHDAKNSIRDHLSRGIIELCKEFQIRPLPLKLLTGQPDPALFMIVAPLSGGFHLNWPTRPVFLL
jgi:hypothetical protein